MNTGYKAPLFVYLLQRADDPEVFKIGLTQYPISRQNSFYKDGKKIPLTRVCMLHYMPIYPDGEVCTSESDYMMECHGYGTQWQYPFYISRRKAFRMEDYFKAKYSSQCCTGKEWFRLTTEDVNNIKRHFTLRAQSDNDFYTKTDLIWASQEVR